MATETTSRSKGPKEGTSSGGTAPDSGVSAAPLPSKIEQMERREGDLWRAALWMLVLLALVIAVISWDKIRAMPGRLEALPVGLVLLVALFGAYVWSKTREVAELRGLVRGFEQHAATPPSEKQLERLFGLISESQQGYRDLIDTFDDVLVAISLQGEIRAANRSFAELLGRPFADVVGRRLDEFLDAPEGAGRETVQKALPRLLERRQWSGPIAVRLRKGGGLHHFDCRVYLMVRDAEVTGISVLARDVTQHRLNEARFTELFETLQEGVFCTTPDGKFLDANPALARMFGYESKEGLMRVNAADLYFNPAERAAGHAEIERLSATQTRQRTLRRKDGTPLHCLISAMPIRDARGQVTRFQGTVMDVTQQRKMERALHEKQELARRMVDSFPDPILVLDTEGHCTYVSPRVEAAMGYTPE